MFVNHCKGYHTNLNSLLIGYGGTPEESDSQLCLDYSYSGCTNADHCPHGYTFLQDEDKKSGICVGPCHPGDKRTYRTVVGPFFDGDLSVEFPVCIPRHLRDDVPTYPVGMWLSLLVLIVLVLIIFNAYGSTARRF